MNQGDGIYLGVRLVAGDTVCPYRAAMLSKIIWVLGLAAIVACGVAAWGGDDMATWPNVLLLVAALVSPLAYMRARRSPTSPSDSR